MHQAPLTSAQFDNVYGPLSGYGLKVIGIDMPGYGMSDPTDVVPRVEDYARAAPCVLDALGIPRAAMVGHHTGALVATETALQFPDRVSALVLAGPFPLTEEERVQFLSTTTVREKALKAQPGGAHLAALFQEREAKAAGSLPLTRVSDLVIQMQSGQAPYWYGHHAAFQYRHDLSLMKIAHRTLILTNTGDSIFAHAQRARALRPDFAYAELVGGGIDIVDQQTEAWCAVVASFLRG
jgi:pimeloyl-ACP methyl ester carboxylesterase